MFIVKYGLQFRSDDVTKIILLWDMLNYCSKQPI